MDFLEIVGVWFGGRFANKALSADHRNDPVYKAKLQELIERNQKFEEERDRSSGASSKSNE